MSAINRIRELLTDARPTPWKRERVAHRDGTITGYGVSARDPNDCPSITCGHLDAATAELIALLGTHAKALCDLAEFARVLHPHPACPPDCPGCAALARLDGESSHA